MYSDDAADDDDAALKEALALSMMPEKKDEKPAENEPQKAEGNQAQEQQPQVDIDANLLKDVIGDLGIELDPSQLDDIVNEAKTANKEGDNKDNDKKDEDKK